MLAKMERGATRFDQKVRLVPLEKKWLEGVTRIHSEIYRNKENFSQKLGKDFIRRTYEWFCLNPNSFGFVALIDEVPAGFIVGTEPGYRTKLNRYRWKTAVYSSLMRPWIPLSKSIWSGLIGGALRYVKDHKTGNNGIDERDFLNMYSLAVLPKYSSFRVSDLLITACEEHAFRMKKKVIFGCVNTSNRSSLLLHHLMGYQVDKSKSGQDSIIFYKKLQDGP